MKNSSVKLWLKKLLEMRFNLSDESVAGLSYRDLFYLITEINEEYNISLPMEVVIRKDLNINIIADYINKELG